MSKEKPRKDYQDTFEAILKTEQGFLLGDIFRLHVFQLESHGRFLIAVIELFHLLEFQGDDFSPELQKTIEAMADVEPEYYGVDGKKIEPTADELEHYASLDYVYDADEDMDWPFHLITDIKPVYAYTPEKVLEDIKVQVQFDYDDKSVRAYYSPDAFIKVRHTHLLLLKHMSYRLNLEEYQLASKLLVGARSKAPKKKEPVKRLPIYGGKAFDINAYKKRREESLQVKCSEPASDQLIKGVFATASPQLLTNPYQRSLAIKKIQPESRVVQIIDKVYD